MDAPLLTALHQFQDGYTRRDVQTLDTFMDLFVSGEELEVIGTSASSTTNDEWCRGRAAVQALVKADWEDWGDLALDLDNACIQVFGDVAWIAAIGTVSQTITADQTYHAVGGSIKHIVDDQALSAPLRMAEIIATAAFALREAQKPEHYVWPIRFTAVLVRQEAQWKFHQIHFSFPIVYSPQVRIA